MRVTAFHHWLVAILLALVAGCADPGDSPLSGGGGAEAEYQEPRLPLAYDDSDLNEEDRALFQAAQAAWEAATGLDLFVDGDTQTIRWVPEAELGPTHVAETNMETGDIILSIEFTRFDRDCLFDSYEFPFPRVLRHELGHALGLMPGQPNFHSTNSDSIMSAQSYTCGEIGQDAIDAVHEIWGHATP